MSTAQFNENQTAQQTAHQQKQSQTAPQSASYAKKALNKEFGSIQNYYWSVFQLGFALPPENHGIINNNGHFRVQGPPKSFNMSACNC